MVNEVLLATVEPTDRDEYVRVWTDAWREAGFTGSHGGRILKCVEDPAKVIVIINWDSLEAHQQHIGTAAFDRFRERLAPFRKEGNIIQHYTGEDIPD